MDRARRCEFPIRVEKVDCAVYMFECMFVMVHCEYFPPSPVSSMSSMASQSSFARQDVLTEVWTMIAKRPGERTHSNYFHINTNRRESSYMAAHYYFPGNFAYVLWIYVRTPSPTNPHPPSVRTICPDDIYESRASPNRMKWIWSSQSSRLKNYSFAKFWRISVWGCLSVWPGSCQTRISRRHIYLNSAIIFWRFANLLYITEKLGATYLRNGFVAKWNAIENGKFKLRAIGDEPGNGAWSKYIVGFIAHI